MFPMRLLSCHSRYWAYTVETYSYEKGRGCSTFRQLALAGKQLFIFYLYLFISNSLRKIFIGIILALSSQRDQCVGHASNLLAPTHTVRCSNCPLRLPRASFRFAMALEADDNPPPERLHAAMDAAVHAERILADALRPFVARELDRALGPDMAPAFAPPATASAAELLVFMKQKWIGVFSDSPAECAKQHVEAARDALAAHARSRTPKDELRTAAGVAHAVEALLLAVQARGPAAQVAEGWARASYAPARASTKLATSSVSNGAPASAMMDVESNPTPSPPTAGTTEPVPSPAFPPPRPDRQPVVLDGSNLAWAHGRSRRFSMYGAAEAAVHFRSRGHAVALVLPDARVRVPPPASAGQVERKAVAWVQSLRGSDMLVATPDVDYDDAYITHLARRAGAVVVSNDRFADQVYQAGADGPAAAKGWRDWIAACRVSFAFQGDTFVPNPAFDYGRAARVARELALPPD